MWLGVYIYTDGMDADFKKARTKKEIVNWFKDMGFTETPEKALNQDDNITYQMIDEGLNVGYLVNLNAKK